VFREFVAGTFQFLIEDVIYVISFTLLGHELPEKWYHASDLLLLYVDFYHEQTMLS
jgi:hypothetical protein